MPNFNLWIYFCIGEQKRAMPIRDHLGLMNECINFQVQLASHQIFWQFSSAIHMSPIFIEGILNDACIHEGTLSYVWGI